MDVLQALMHGVIGSVIAFCGLRISIEPGFKSKTWMKTGLCLWGLAGIGMSFLAQRLFGTISQYFPVLAAYWFMEFNTITDYYSGYIYDPAAVLAVLGGLLLKGCSAGWNSVCDVLFGSIAAASPVGIVILLSRGAVGLGDMTMMAGLGALLGWKTALLALYLGIITGGTIALVLLLFRRIRRKDTLPFAPFLLIGLILTLLFGQQIAARMGSSLAW